jgi:hypothetical protein
VTGSLECFANWAEAFDASFLKENDIKQLFANIADRPTRR